MFGLLKINRSIATRYDELAASFLSMESREFCVTNVSPGLLRVV
jgi:hypothetical protein